MIKFQDLTRLHETIASELNHAFQETLSKSDFIGGASVQSFEKDFGLFTESKHAIAVANGTDALEIVLEALALKPQSKVFVPSMTFAATAECIVRNGLIPVFCETDTNTGGIDTKDLETKIQKNKTDAAAIIAVHLYGRPCNILEISKISKENNLFLIEDCAQAHGAKVSENGIEKHVGSWGIASTYSFYPGKNLGALGDGGMICSNSDSLAKQCKMIRDHGRTDKYAHSEIGRNSRLDALQARFLSIKLRYLTKWNENRIKLANLYDKLLENSSVVTPLKSPSSGEKHVYHLYVVRVKNNKRDQLKNFLKENGVESLIHYPIPLHQQKAFSKYSSEELKKSEQFALEILSLPMDPLMTEEEVRKTVSALESFK